MAALNKAVGFQALIALSTNLYMTIFQLYKYTTAFERFANTTSRQHAHSALSIANLCLKLIVYLSMGQIVKAKVSKNISN